MSTPNPEHHHKADNLISVEQNFKVKQTNQIHIAFLNSSPMFYVKSSSASSKDQDYYEGFPEKGMDFC